LIDAYSRLKKQYAIDDYKLVIVGKKSHDYASTLKKIEENDVVYLDFVSHDLLVWLYKHAKLFVFPSIYEGFGFPPLEAGVNGTISAVSNVSSIPEVCGDAAIYFNPYDIDEMAGVMFKALTNEDVISNLSCKILEQVDKFSWRKNALETIKIYKKVASHIDSK
jgi:glycosyltransferase involved in cell wall biosynthesis